MINKKRIRNIDSIIICLNNFWLSIEHTDYSNFKNYRNSSIREIESIIDTIKNLKFFKDYFVDVITRKIKTEKGKHDKDFEFWILKDLGLSLSGIKSFTSGNMSHSKIRYNLKAVINNLRLFKIFLSS